MRRADPSSRGVIPTVVCQCVWSRNLSDEAALACVGLLRQEKTTHKFKLHHIVFHESKIRLSPTFVTCFVTIIPVVQNLKWGMRAHAHTHTHIPHSDKLRTMQAEESVSQSSSTQYAFLVLDKICCSVKRNDEWPISAIYLFKPQLSVCCVLADTHVTNVTPNRETACGRPTQETAIRKVTSWSCSFRNVAKEVAKRGN
jgi:hypothetical protein